MSLLLSRTARRRHGLEGAFGRRGRVGVPTFFQARLLALDLGAALGDSGPRATAGRLNALSELERSFRRLLEVALDGDDVAKLRRILRRLIRRYSKPSIDRLLSRFAHEFMLFELPEGWTDRLSSEAGELIVRQAGDVLREMLLVAWIDDVPAADGLQGVLLESAVVEESIFAEVAETLVDEIVREADPPPSGDAPVDEGIADVRSRDSLREQLNELIERWPSTLEAEEPFVVAALDLIEEEERPRFPPDGAGPPIELPAYSHLNDEPADYSPDTAWMRGLAIIAKNTFVWLDQLSRRYERKIERLDEIPDRELQRLVDRGTDALWLIGVWERSPASRRIKQLCGNAEAEASAYSLRAYRIAEELGGEASLSRLRLRTARLGLKLAADMVPNHLGVDSEWIYDHPERFLSLAGPPYPTYTFEGPNLSDRAGVEIRIEDHYYDRSDAAVVFERLEVTSGERRYVYHGNDGTTTPWNDTAQLDYLQSAVREAVIGEVLKIAESFPVIRFDAAMTLARAHVQRLWYPEPGSAGAIPSRAEHALPQAAFDAALPREFWRDVVDRVAAERPETLLLAEAFWLMESYFVRSLGVHRVYNSAFMHLLRDGRNRKYRELLKETVRFDPRILQRYVNFMTNPDEQTARGQFGSEDRYFGVCALLATLPGTPLFGHGQFEGLREKYGMEFRRPLLDETEDARLATRHREEISPLLHRRELFSGSQHFRLYDFVDDSGRVRDEVYAFSNRFGDEAAFVLFNHSTEPFQGSVRRSVPFRVGDAGEPRRQTLTDALGLDVTATDFWLFADSRSGREFVRSGRELEERGAELRLRPYEFVVLEGFRSLGPDRDGALLAATRGETRWGEPLVEARLSTERLKPAAAKLRAFLQASRQESADDGGTPWQRAAVALVQELESVGFVEPQESTRLHEVAEQLAGLPDLGDPVDALPWPETRRLGDAHSAWRKRWSAGRSDLLRIVAMLSEIAGAAPSGQRFLELLRAENGLARAAERLLPDDPGAGEVAGRALRARWPAAETPPGYADFVRLAVDAESWRNLEVGLDWRFAGAAIGWLAAETGDRAELPEDAIVGWLDALTRLREETEDAS